MMEPSQPSPPRYSSPFGPVKPFRPESAKATAENSQMKQQTLMNWVEPGVAPARPSPFAGAGLQRQDAVADTTPSSALPMAETMIAAAKPDLMHSLVSGGMVKKSGASSVSATPSASFTTPEPTTNPPRRHSLPSAVTAPEKATLPPAQVPASPVVAPTQPPPAPRTPPQQTTPRPPSQGQAYGQSVFALQKPIPNNLPRPVPQPVAPPPMLNGDINLAKTDKVVEMAVQMALDAGRWPTAYALRTLYDDHRLNPRMVRLIDAIYEDRADIDQEREFRAVLTHKKKEGKKGRTGEYYFNGDGSDPLPPPRPAQFPAVNAPPSSQGTPSRRSATGGRSMSDAHAFNMSASPYKDASEPPSHHVSKKHKGNDFIPPPDLEMEVNGSGSGNGIVNGMPHQPPAQQNEDATPNSTERARSRSNSTTSSLSSVDDAVLRSGNLSNTASPLQKNNINNNKNKDSSHGGLGGAHTQSQTQASPRFAAHANANTTSAAAESHPSMRNQSQPISAAHKPGPKTFTFSTVNSSSPAGALPSPTNNPAHARSSRPRHSSSTTSSSMAPAALLPPSAPSPISSPYLPPSAVFKTKKDPSKAVPRPDAENDRSHLKRDAERKRARENPYPAVESFVRHQVPLPEVESASDAGDSIAAGTLKRPTVKLFHKKTRQSQAANYDSDTLSSPTLLSFQPDIAPGSLSVSRAGTPNNFRPTRKAKTGTGLRVKTSPMKKKGGGPLAGIPRASGERNSPTGNGAFSNSNSQDDNDDYCSSCGGNGDLVCCDGCARSFHFKCVDPPMSEGSLPDEWFCNVCFTARLPRREPSGIFGSLLGNLERKNPSAFHLPKDIREYFENVKTGTEGEYEEAAPPKTRQRAGYDEQPDYFKLKDSKGKTIFCHGCQGAASAPNHGIIPCTYCGLSWHLDCLDVPMAKEPAVGKAWRCPAHIDDLLAKIPGSLAPAHRFRKIKGASVIKPALTRGIKNNGQIEIENDPTDDEEELGFYDQREYGHVYKLPELGVKLDFISQVRRKTGGGYKFFPPQRRAKSPPPPRNSSWNERALDEKQAALNLASLAIPRAENGDASVLINALLAEAPPNVIALIAKGDVDTLATKNLALSDKKSLLALMAFLESKLSGIEALEEQAATQETSPAVSDVLEAVPEVETEPAKEAQLDVATELADEVQMEVEVQAEDDMDIEMSG